MQDSAQHKGITQQQQQQQQQQLSAAKVLPENAKMVHFKAKIMSSDNITAAGVFT